MDLLLVKRTKTWSHLNQCHLERYGWYNVDTKEYYETTVDESYDNYVKNGWKQLANESNPYGAYTNLQFAKSRGKIKTTNDNIPIVSADSQFNLLMRLTEQQMIDLVNLAESK